MVIDGGLTDLYEQDFLILVCILVSGDMWAPQIEWKCCVPELENIEKDRGNKAFLRI